MLDPKIMHEEMEHSYAYLTGWEKGEARLGLESEISANKASAPRTEPPDRYVLTYCY